MNDNSFKEVVMDISGPNVLFPRILKDRDNEEVLNEALEIQALGDAVISRLVWQQENLVKYWWEDKQLIELFTDLYKSGCMLLPRDSVDRLRWIALLCVSFGKIYNFELGNTVTALDFFPIYLVELFQDKFAKETSERILGIRQRLDKEGWEAVFGA